LYQYECPKVITHAESIEIISELGGKFTPELKAPEVTMPFNGFTQEDYAQKMIDEYIDARISPSRVWPQSFNKEDCFYWIQNTDYGNQAVALDPDDASTPEQVTAWIDELKENGVKIVAPPTWRLVDPSEDSPYKMVPSFYADYATEAGLKIITWTLERTPPGLKGYYWQTLDSVALVDGDNYNLLYVLAKEIKILGIFSDWPATVTFFANCMGLKLR
jgi:glycerophosphoryl diester phosphodiesterase